MIASTMGRWLTLTQLVRASALLLGVASLAACGDSRTRTGTTDAGPDRTDAARTDGSTIECPAGESYFYPGCGSGEEVTITAGCYRPCTDAGDASCPAGTTCRRTDINPCVCPPGSGGCCAACGSEQWLCLAPDAGDTDPYELSSLDDTCEGVVTGRQVLAIEDSYTATFEYIDGTPSTDLLLAFDYTDGTILCHPAIPAPPGSGAPDQPAYLEVEVAAQISTTDGAFAESVTATLTGYGPGTTQLSVRLDVASLAGTYEPRLMDLVSHGITFGGQLMGPTTSGSAVENGTRASGVGETIGVGSWAN